MSVQTLYTAATGMQALETKLDVIAHNLANVNTTAFKKNRANFEDLFYRNQVLPGAEDTAGGKTATGTAVGLGVRVSSTQTDYKQGALQQTNNPLDVSIEGPGFFQVQDPNKGVVYTRAGNFSINANGAIVLGSSGVGRLLEPNINIPSDALAVSINPSGSVLVSQPGSNTPQQVGQIQIVNFINPEGLLKAGENIFLSTDASGAPTAGNPGDVGLGVLKQGALEASNVEPVQELIDLITTQRSFELNSQAIQAGDQLLQVVANLRRG